MASNRSGLKARRALTRDQIPVTLKKPPTKSSEESPDSEATEPINLGFSAAARNQHSAILRDLHNPASYRQEVASRLQSTFGNRYTSSLLSNSSQYSSRAIQTKMSVGPAGDKFETEADDIAKSVIHQISHGTTTDTPDISPLDRPNAAMTRSTNVEEERVEREGIEYEEQPVARPIGLEGGNVTQGVQSLINNSRGSGRSIDENVRAPLEDAFDTDFSDVKIHNGPESTALNDSMSARAFTTGNDIFFRQGEYKPNSLSGKEILAHELTHVVQQNGQSSINRWPWSKRAKKVAIAEEEEDFPETRGRADATADLDGPLPETRGRADATADLDGPLPETRGRSNAISESPTEEEDGDKIGEMIGKASTLAGYTESVAKTAESARSGTLIENEAVPQEIGVSGNMAAMKAADEVGVNSALAGQVGAGAKSVGGALEYASMANDFRKKKTTGEKARLALTGVKKVGEKGLSAGAGLLLNVADVAEGASKAKTARKQRAAITAASDRFENGSEAQEIADVAKQSANAQEVAGKAQALGGAVELAVAAGLGASPVGLAILGAVGLVKMAASVYKQLNQRAEGQKLVQDKTEEHEKELSAWNARRDELRAGQQDMEKGFKERDDIRDQYNEHIAAGPPELDERYDVSRLGNMPWSRGYGTIFREEQDSEMRKIADTLFRKVVDRGEDHELAQIVAAMDFRISTIEKTPTSKDMFDYLKKGI